MQSILFKGKSEALYLLKVMGGKEMRYILRKAQVDDLEDLGKVMLVISDQPADPEKVAQLIHEIGENPQKYLLVAEDSETHEIVGSLLGVVFEDICGDCRPILLVENVAVLEKYQGQGIGRLMFEKIEAWGKEMNCHYEILVSGMGRTGAHKFYSALGFEEVKGFKKYL